MTGVSVCEGAGATKVEHTSLCQSQEDVLHQHCADHHFLTVDCQLGCSFFFGRHGDQHQAAAAHRPACEPVDRMIRRRNRRTEVKAAKVGNKDEAAEIKEDACVSISRFFVPNKKQYGEQSDRFSVT